MMPLWKFLKVILKFLNLDLPDGKIEYTINFDINSTDVQGYEFEIIELWRIILRRTGGTPDIK